MCTHVENVKANINGFGSVRQPGLAHIDREQHISNNVHVQVVRRQLIRRLKVVRGRNFSVVSPKLVAEGFIQKLSINN